MNDDERIVRLIHSRIEEPDYEPFNRKELVATGEFTNVCGDADGASVTRRGLLTDDEICMAADELAAFRPGRVGRGGMLARSGDIRSIRLPGSQGQVCFVYDDPMIQNLMHAVVRIRDGLPREKVDEARVYLRAKFKERIRPHPVPVTDEEVILNEGAFVCVVPKKGA